MKQAATNSLITVHYGIRGIGRLLAQEQAPDSDGVDDETLTDVGWLLDGLGAMAETLMTIENKASYIIAQQAGIKSGVKL